MIALVYPHVVPHPPQLEFVVKGVSHPLSILPSQFSQEEKQEENWQVFVEQSENAFGWEHTIPQPLQFDVVVKDVSQPFPVYPSQSPNPE